jgi:hypothetical protein
VKDAKQEHLRMIRQVAESLGDIRAEVVFVGGITTTLMLTDPAAQSVRATDDVDLIASLASRTAYYKFAERLRAHGCWRRRRDSNRLGWGFR